MQNGLVSLDEAARLLESGRCFAVAADRAVLEKLPRGAWIGGSIPYFVGQAGGVCSREQVFLCEIPVPGDPPQIRFYAQDDLAQVYVDAPENGFSLIILPAFSPVHSDFARHAPDYPEAFFKPLVGWVAGMHLDDLGKARAAVVQGAQGALSENAAVVMHVPLPAGYTAHIDIVNLFRPGDGPCIRFPRTGFAAGDCLLDGVAANFAEYLRTAQIDTRLPLVADYCGAMVNVSIQRVDDAQGSVEFYAPVFAGMDYRIAWPVHDYVAEFSAALPCGGSEAVFSCNCILNYVHSQLAGKRTGALVGPATFGEVAYQLLNQTLVYLRIDH